MTTRIVRAALLPALLFASAGLLDDCGGSSVQPSLLPSASSPTNSTAPAWKGTVAAASFSITIPVATRLTTQAAARTPQYVPASTRSVAILVLEVGGTSVSTPAIVTTVSPGTLACSTVANGNYTCTVAGNIPIGSDETQIATYDAAGAAGNVLSEQLYSAVVLEGHANQFGSAASPIRLDANPGAISVVAASGETGTYPAFTLASSATATFTVGVVDAHGTAFGALPGLPTMTHAAATGTGASATLSGTTLTLTPPSSGASNVVIDADPAGTQDVTTTLTSSPALGATSFTVASASGIFIGQNLVLDYESFSGTTLLQEAATVTGVAGTTITVAAGLLHAHTTGSGVRHYSDNLAPSTAPFTATIGAPTVIVPVAAEDDNVGPSKALPFNGSLALQAGSLTSSSDYFYDRFDSTGRLFIADQNDETVYRSQYTAGTGFGAVTTYSGIPSQDDDFGFDVSSNGTVAVENSDALPQLDIYTPSASSPAPYNTALGTEAWQTATEGGFPTVAVLADSSETVFGYAYDVYQTDGDANDRIVVTNGSTEQDVSGSAITSNFVNNGAAPVLTWDQGRQSLIYLNSEPDSSPTSVLEFPRSGTAGAVLQTSPTTIGSVNGYPLAVAASRDGSYVAVAWNSPADTCSVSIFHNNGTVWSLSSGAGALANDIFPNFTALHFLPSGNLLISDSAGDGSTANLWQFTNAGAQVGSTYNAMPNFGTGYSINDFAVSY